MASVYRPFRWTLATRHVECRAPLFPNHSCLSLSNRFQFVISYEDLKRQFSDSNGKLAKMADMLKRSEKIYPLDMLIGKEVPEGVDPGRKEVPPSTLPSSPIPKHQPNFSVSLVRRRISARLSIDPSRVYEIATMETFGIEEEKRSILNRFFQSNHFSFFDTIYA